MLKYYKVSAMRVLKRLKRLLWRHKDLELFYLQEKTPGRNAWADKIKPVGEEPSKVQCQEFFCPGRFYRLLARDLDSGRLRTIWTHWEKNHSVLKSIMHACNYWSRPILFFFPFFTFVKAWAP
jgi:hypothetical protein